MSLTRVAEALDFPGAGRAAPGVRPASSARAALAAQRRHPLTTALDLLKTKALNPSHSPQGGRPAKAGARIQFLVVLAIFALAGLIPLLAFGVRAALGRFWVEPACQERCRVSGSVFTEIVYDTPKRGGDHSACVCSSGARIPSSQANTASLLSLSTPFFLLVIVPALGVYGWSRRSRRTR